VQLRRPLPSSEEHPATAGPRPCATPWLARWAVGTAPGCWSGADAV